MYQVIARKYRPQTFAELIGQEHVRTTLENAITQQRIAHGYIFAGQRGTGKTTIARILARCLNCVEGPTGQPCGKCSSCLEVTQGNAPDVIEIDAASNRGINEMRELRENVRYRPSRDRYKVFIIDEAHQITNEAFNALLKTLEEPPEWVVFVMCTTESHKIPATIASRCQQFSFRSVEFAEVVSRMEWICGQEGITADAEALAVIAQSGEGSVRDSLSALDQAIACCGTSLEGPAVRDLLGMYSLESLGKVALALEESSTGGMLEIVAELESAGKNLQHFCRELARFFRNLLVARIAGKDTRLIAASSPEQARLRETAGRFSEEDLTRWLQLTLEMYGQLQYSMQPRLHLELGLMRLVHAGRMKPIEDALKELAAGSPAAVAAPTGPRAASVSERPRTAGLPGAAAVKAGGGNPLATARGSSAGANPLATARGAGAGADPLATARGSSAGADPLATARGSSAGADPLAIARGSSAGADPLATARGAGAGAGGLGSLKERLIAALEEVRAGTSVHAVEESEIVEGQGLVEFIAPKAARMGLMAKDVEKALAQVLGRAVKTKITLTDEAAPAPETATPAAGGEATERALAHPDVKRFQETFPGSQVRAVRDLKEYES